METYKITYPFKKNIKSKSINQLFKHLQNNNFMNYYVINNEHYFINNKNAIRFKQFEQSGGSQESISNKFKNLMDDINLLTNTIKQQPNNKLQNVISSNYNTNYIYTEQQFDNVLNKAKNDILPQIRDIVCHHFGDNCGSEMNKIEGRLTMHLDKSLNDFLIDMLRIYSRPQSFTIFPDSKFTDDPYLQSSNITINPEPRKKQESTCVLM